MILHSHFQLVKFLHFGIESRISRHPKASVSDEMGIELQSNQLYYKADMLEESALIC